MTPQELIKLCDQNLSKGNKHVLLVFPKGISSRIKGFGRGELCCVNSKNERVFWFKADKVKATTLSMLDRTISNEAGL